MSTTKNAETPINDVSWKLRSMASGVLLIGIFIAILVLIFATSSYGVVSMYVSFATAAGSVVFWGAFRGLAEVIQILHDIRAEVRKKR